MTIDNKRRLNEKLKMIFVICDKLASPELIDLYGRTLGEKAGDLLWHVLDEFACRGGRLPSPGEIIERYQCLERANRSYTDTQKRFKQMDDAKAQSMTPAAEKARLDAMASISKLLG